jgi:GNAT superfamily N-acetyltransferase
MKIRKALKTDVPHIIKMWAEDEFSSAKELFQEPLPSEYYRAFDIIDNDNTHELVVLESEEGKIIGSIQLTFIQHLIKKGGVVAHIEAVMVHQDYRGKGIGQKLMQWAIERAKERKAVLIQFTSNKKREKSIAFYKKMGFSDSHVGFKMNLKY